MSKKIIAISLVSAAILITLSSCQSGEENLYPYNFSTAKIVYKIDGNSAGQRTMFIKGNKSSSEIHASRTNNGIEEKLDMLSIDTGEYIYQIDLNTKTGSSSKNPIYNELKNLTGRDRAEFLTKLAVGMTAGSTQQPQPKEQKQIAGQTCDLYVLPNVGEICVWNGLTIYSKMELPQAGISDTMTATSIETGLEISDQKFEIPNGIKMEDLSR